MQMARTPIAKRIADMIRETIVANGGVAALAVRAAVVGP